MEEQCWREFEFDADVHPTATTWPNVAAIDSAHFRTWLDSHLWGNDKVDSMRSASLHAERAIQRNLLDQGGHVHAFRQL